MRIQTDGTITLEARECRVLREAAAIMEHLARHEGGDASTMVEASLREAVNIYSKPPAPEPPPTGKGKKGANDGDPD